MALASYDVHAVGRRLPAVLGEHLLEGRVVLVLHAAHGREDLLRVRVLGVLVVLGQPVAEDDAAAPMSRGTPTRSRR